MKFLYFFAILALVAVALAQVPPEWTCQPEIFDGNDACDCNCGAFDPDCNSIRFVRGCEDVDGAVSFCDDDGVCDFIIRDVPDDWFCEDIDYNNGDGICHCGCGAIDPDCENPLSVAECPNGLNPTCSEEGTCVYEAPLPEGWVCSGYAYDSQNGCDCSCGIPDPDCEFQTLEVFGCPCEEMACIEGYCAGFCEGNMLFVTDASLARDVTQTTPAPVEQRFRIEHAAYRMPDAEVAENNSELPFFDRNGINREVHPSTLKRYIHTTHPSEHVKSMLHQWGVFDPQQTDVLTIARRAPMKRQAPRETPPPEWTCSPAFFGTLDGCDCECGAHDPDCDTQPNFVFNCDRSATFQLEGNFRPTCNAQDLCEFNEIEIPEEWRCDPDFYAFADGCDCQCGVLDPDCDQPDQFVFNCNKGIGPSCNENAACEYSVLIPEEWSCPFFFYLDGDCDCNCGAQDPDCEDSQARVLGCGQCDGDLITCEAGFCVGECNGVFLTLEALEYWNPLLQANAPNIEEIDYFGGAVEYSELFSIDGEASFVTPEDFIPPSDDIFFPSDDGTDDDLAPADDSEPELPFQQSELPFQQSAEESSSPFTGGRLDRSSDQSSAVLLSASLGLIAALAIAAF